MEKRVKDDIARYKQIDYLKEKISKSPFYSIIYVLYEIMCINNDEIPDRQVRFPNRKIFLHDLAIVVVRGYFSVGVYKYTRLGSISD